MYGVGTRLYAVEHDHGTTHLYAHNEQDAIEQFRAKYPSYRIYRVIPK